MFVSNSTPFSTRCKTEASYRAIPDPVFQDPEITETDIRLLAALLWHCRSRSYCWPSNDTLRKRIGRSEGYVRKRLASLQERGYIRREACSDNWTGRRIFVTWLERDGDRPRETQGQLTLAETEGVRAECSPPPARRVRTKGIVVVKETNSENPPTPLRQRSEPEPPAKPASHAKPYQPPHQAVPEPEAEAEEPPGIPPGLCKDDGTPLTEADLKAAEASLSPGSAEMLAQCAPRRKAQLLAWLASGDKVLMGEAQRALRPREKIADRPPPGSIEEFAERMHENPAYPVMFAETMARMFNDRKSWHGFYAIAKAIYEGRLAVDRFLEAFRQAIGPKARNGPAVMWHAMGGRKAVAA